MKQAVRDTREAELAALLAQVRERPERAWTEERRRIAVLQRALAAGHRASATVH